MPKKQKWPGTYGNAFGKFDQLAHTDMKITIGVMGSAGDTAPINRKSIMEKAEGLGQAIARHDVVLLSGATTGVVYVVGKAAHDAGVLHVGISPAHNSEEHTKKYKLPLDACDLIVYTGFGLKGRNVVLVRSCDIVLFIAGGMGSLNEFTIAHDESRVIGCLTNSGGVADEANFLLRLFSKDTCGRIVQDSDPNRLIDLCLDALKSGL
jgi:uncharacterized protein (TIGR00725 family)